MGLRSSRPGSGGMRDTRRSVGFPEEGATAARQHHARGAHQAGRQVGGKVARGGNGGFCNVQGPRFLYYNQAFFSTSSVNFSMNDSIFITSSFLPVAPRARTLTVPSCISLSPTTAT